MANGAQGQFAGASAVVTGAGQGIGAAIATGLARNGAHVVLSGRRAATLEAVCSAIKAEGGSAEYCAGDVTDPLHLEQLAAMAAGSRGVLDILVNNAGIPGPMAPLVDVSLEEWNQTIAVNLTGVFLACKAALPYLKRSERGRIVNIGSVSGKQPLPNRSPCTGREARSRRPYPDPRPRGGPCRHNGQPRLALARGGRAAQGSHLLDVQETGPHARRAES